MNLYTNILGLVIGMMLMIWGGWMIYNYIQLPSSGKKYKKVQLWLSILIFMIGVADLSKAIRDILKGH